MAPVVRALAGHPDEFRSVVCVTGQHREMLDRVLELFEIVPDHDLAVMRPDQTLTDVTTAVLRGLEPVVAGERPDWLLVQGDTTTAIAGALAAYYQRVAVAHVEAGLRTGDKYRPFPEEVNRKLVSAIADLHLAPTTRAAENLRAEGIPDERVVVTGNTVIDAIRHVGALPYDPAGTELAALPADKRIVLVTAHRRETFGRGIEEICAGLRELAEGREDVHLVYAVHPNPNIAGPVHRLLAGVPNLTLLAPLDYRPMVWLLRRSSLVITDSGGLQEEAPGLGKPVLVVRDTTERPEGVEAGTVRLVGADRARIVAEAARLLDDPAAYDAMARSVNPYGDGHAAGRIVAALRSRT